MKKYRIDSDRKIIHKKRIIAYNEELAYIMNVFMFYRKGDDEALKVEEEFVRAAYLMDIEDMIYRVKDKTKAAVDMRRLRDCLSGEPGRHILGMIGDDSSQERMQVLLRKAKEIASAVDERGKSGEKELLANIFNRFSSTSEKPTSYYMSEVFSLNTCQYPKSDGADDHTEGYGKILESMMEEFSKRDIWSRGTNDFLRVMETTLSYVPASDTAGGYRISRFMTTEN